MAMTNQQMLITTKRLKGEIKNLEKEREAYYQVVQDDVNKFMFYFLLRGSPDSPYKDGYYIGKIILPQDYPANPGDFYMLTPSGRFSVNSKICLTNSGYHKESWTPMWNIKNMVIGFVSVFLTDNTSGISHIQEASNERIKKARDSMTYNMANHYDICMKFDQFVKPDGTLRTNKEIDDFVNKLREKKVKKKDNEHATTEIIPEPTQEVNTQIPDITKKHTELQKLIETMTIETFDPLALNKYLKN
jgi:ubiquitin-conjugating enzyme E2 J2